MRSDRRDFLKKLGWFAGCGAGAVVTPSAQASSGGPELGQNVKGVLVDLNQCIGCCACEMACRKSNEIDIGLKDIEENKKLVAQPRRPDPDSFTVINRYERTAGVGAADPAAKPVHVKVNCLHCNHPACVSACIVGALEKKPDGKVVYDAWKCIGCRYCMVACPFQIPAYSYDNVLTPEVRKCTFCDGKETPECVKACTYGALTFGTRDKLIHDAHDAIAKPPKGCTYVPHVYGEHEVGGTSWMYLSPVPFEEVGFLKLGTAAPPALTEAIQHGVFKYWIAPVGWYTFLATAMWWTGRRSHVAAAEHEPHTAHQLPSQREERAQSAGQRQVSSLHAESGTSVAVLDPPAAETKPSPDHAADHDEHGHDQDHGHDEHEDAAPVRAKLLTPGVWALIALVITGIGFGLYRFIFGLAASTNLDQQHPWGLWIAMDVGSGIALAGGGFVTAAVAHIFHRHHYHTIARSALLTALLGYTFYVPGLLADIGRWYNIWHPLLPNMWQGNSVLFEVGLCVMIYLNVQYVELTPILCEPIMKHRQRFPRLAAMAAIAHKVCTKLMPAMLVLGVCLSTFHQSSLGNLMVIAPYKLHHLWWTPISPLLFLVSAMMVGFPMVIFTILFASKCLKRSPEMHVLAPFSRYIIPLLFVYLGLKVGDVVYRDMHKVLLDRSLESFSWIAEMAMGVVAPLVLLLIPGVRRSAGWLATVCLMIILGVVLNRLNCFVIAYHPPYATRNYFPSVTEFAVSIGLVAALLLTYRVAVTYLPILSPRPEAK